MSGAVVDASKEEGGYDDNKRGEVCTTICRDDGGVSSRATIHCTIIWEGSPVDTIRDAKSMVRGKVGDRKHVCAFLMEKC